ncbi:MAG: hypothetical protein IKW85_07635 [Muribaculaceae bacterium]|nr:hypothetical protein [Muribaculaceae bacterium]
MGQNNKQQCNWNCDMCKDKCDRYYEYLEEQMYGEHPDDRITDEDIWDAWTDGMYGDCPEGPFDRDLLGF